jgi:hypothetical protein
LPEGAPRRAGIAALQGFDARLGKVIEVRAIEVRAIEVRAVGIGHGVS